MLPKQSERSSVSEQVTIISQFLGGGSQHFAGCGWEVRGSVSKPTPARSLCVFCEIILLFPSLVNVSGGESSTAKDRMRPALWFGLRDLKFPTIVLKKRQFKIERRDSAEPSGSAHLTTGASGLKPPPALLPPTLQPSHSTQHLLLV